MTRTEGISHKRGRDECQSDGYEEIDLIDPKEKFGWEIGKKDSTSGVPEGVEKCLMCLCPVISLLIPLEMT